MRSRRKYPDLGERRLVHEVIRRMINYVVVDLIRTTQARLDEAAPASIDDVRRRAKPLAGMSAEVRAEHLELKKFLNEHVYHHYKVLRMTTKSRRVITELFEAFMKDVNLMPTEHRDAADRAQAVPGQSRPRPRSRGLHRRYDRSLRDPRASTHF